MVLLKKMLEVILQESCSRLRFSRANLNDFRMLLQSPVVAQCLLRRSASTWNSVQVRGHDLRYGTDAKGTLWSDKMQTAAEKVVKVGTGLGIQAVGATHWLKPARATPNNLADLFKSGLL